MISRLRHRAIQCHCYPVNGWIPSNGGASGALVRRRSVTVVTRQGCRARRHHHGQLQTMLQLQVMLQEQALRKLPSQAHQVYRHAYIEVQGLRYPLEDPSHSVYVYIWCGYGPVHEQRNRELLRLFIIQTTLLSLPLEQSNIRAFRNLTCVHEKIVSKTLKFAHKCFPVGSLVGTSIYFLIILSVLACTHVGTPVHIERPPPRPRTRDTVQSIS
jgi:hypothetical protein